eukprot:gene885-biopygen3192
MFVSVCDADVLVVDVVAAAAAAAAAAAPAVVVVVVAAAAAVAVAGTAAECDDGGWGPGTRMINAHGSSGCFPSASPEAHVDRSDAVGEDGGLFQSGLKPTPTATCLSHRKVRKRPGRNILRHSPGHVHI